MLRALSRHRLLAMALAVAAASPSPRGYAKELDRHWTAPTPDGMIERAARVAAQGGPDALARTLLIHSLASEASAGTARKALDTLGKSHGAVAEQARWLARMLEPESHESLAKVDRVPRTAATVAGMIRTFSVLGPFADTGGGLFRREGPEAPRHDFRSADYSWGAYAVRPIQSVPFSVTARGLPLDLYIHPRRESCSYFSSAVTVPSARKLVVHVASTGSIRLRWDGHDALVSSEHHRRLRLDRASVAILAAAGDHLIDLKVCTSALADEGRARIRLTASDGEPLDLETSSDPERLQAALEQARGRDAVAFETLPTALAAALALEASTQPPTVDPALTSALVRILGGADDLHAARGPGLLELLAGSTELDADRLALAGYLAPFGANRSGWLERASARAHAEGDHDALSFAQRALVLARLAALQHDLAYATLNQAPLAQADDVQAELIRAEVLARLGNHGLRVKALMALDRVVKRAGAQASEAVWRALGQFAQATRPATHLGMLQRLSAIAPGYRGYTYTQAYEFVGSDSVARVAREQVLHVTEARELERIGQLLIELGRYDEARQIFALSTELSPNRAAGHEGMARALEALGAREGDAIVRALARKKELDPRDTVVAAELAYREGKSAGHVELGPDAPFLVAPAVFLARAKESPAPAEGLFERQLHWRRVVRLHGDKRISQTIHYAREILVEPRTENERYERVPSSGSSSELLLARLHRPDGTVLFPEEQDASGATIRWPKLTRGDVVEVAVRTFTPGPVGRRGDAPFYFVDYVGSIATRPVLYNEVVIDAPVGSALAFDVVGGKPDRRVDDTVDGRQVTQLIWDAPPQIADEPLSPPPSETMPVVVGSVYPNWKEFLDWYRGAIAGFTEPDAQIVQLATELTQGKKTREEKLEALFNYVADDIRYVNYTSGEWWLPNRPQELLARKQGDCDDKANLLISLLGAIGIEATEALVQTRYTGQPRILFESKIAVPMFDHGVVFLKDADGKSGRFLDPTSPQSRMGSPPQMDLRAAALLVSDATVAPIPTPQASSEEHGVNADWSFELKKDGSAKLSATERHKGDPAFFLRVNLRQVDARAQWVEANLSRWLTKTKVDANIGFDGDLADGEAKLDYRGTTGALARHEGDELLVAIAPPAPIAVHLAPLKKRTLPVVLPPHMAPTHQDMTITILVPDGYAVAALPPDDDLPAHELGTARQSFELSGDKRKVIVRRSLRLGASRIEPARYGEWRTWLRNVDRMMQRAVRLTPKKK